MYSLNDCARHCRLLLKKWRRKASKIGVLTKVYLCVRNFSKRVLISLLTMLLAVYLGGFDLVAMALYGGNMQTKNVFELYNENEVVTVLNKEDALRAKFASTMAFEQLVTAPFFEETKASTTTVVTTTTVTTTTTTSTTVTTTTTTTTTSTIEEVEIDYEEVVDYDDVVEYEDEYETVEWSNDVEEEQTTIAQTDETEDNIPQFSIANIQDLARKNYNLCCNVVGAEAGADYEDIFEKTGVLVVIFNRYYDWYEKYKWESISDLVNRVNFTGDSSIEFDSSELSSEAMRPLVQEAVQSFIDNTEYYMSAHGNIHSYWGDGWHNHYY